MEHIKVPSGRPLGRHPSLRSTGSAARSGYSDTDSHVVLCDILDAIERLEARLGNQNGRLVALEQTSDAGSSPITSRHSESLSVTDEEPPGTPLTVPDTPESQYKATVEQLRSRFEFNDDEEAVEQEEDSLHNASHLAEDVEQGVANDDLGTSMELAPEDLRQNRSYLTESVDYTSTKRQSNAYSLSVYTDQLLGPPTSGPTYHLLTDEDRTDSQEAPAVCTCEIHGRLIRSVRELERPIVTAMSREAPMSVPYKMTVAGTPPTPVATLPKKSFSDRAIVRSKSLRARMSRLQKAAAALSQSAQTSVVGLLKMLLKATFSAGRHAPSFKKKSTRRTKRETLAASGQDASATVLKPQSRGGVASKPNVVATMAHCAPRGFKFQVPQLYSRQGKY